jgi:hypothetical protein
MNKLTIADAATHLSVSKEAIHNRIRRGSLKSIVENGVKFVILDNNKATSGTNTATDNRYVQYIESENIRLRDRVDVLETETTRLRDQREEMLIAQRVSVEEIYKERDAQLRNILNVVATRFLSHVNPDMVVREGMGQESVEQEAPVVTYDHEAINAHIIPDMNLNDEWVSLKSFLKLKRYPDVIKKNLKRRFKAAALERDERFVEKNDKLYLNPSLYDYSDLLKGAPLA